MIRLLSRVAFWLLLLAVMMLSPGYSEAQDTCRDNWCRYLIPESDPLTYVYNNLWNTRGARGSQSITLYGSTSNDIWGEVLHLLENRSGMHSCSDEPNTRDAGWRRRQEEHPRWSRGYLRPSRHTSGWRRC